jgi:2-ketocyclohexanecarboxyl-CoA hydrolase
MNYEDILYDETGGVATITINRPKVYNAFRARTCDEIIDAFHPPAGRRTSA